MENAAAAQATAYVGSQAFAYALVTFIAAITVFALLLCYHSLRRATGWSLTDALSEEVTLSQMTNDGVPILAPAQPPTPGAPATTTVQTVMVTTLRASSSRVIALVGTISILMLYIGFGLAYLNRFVVTGQVPELGNITQFFYAGLVLFAPYIANKFASIFSYFT
ncbi:hypothetical protein [Rhizobium sp. RAF56]|jgi:hypothetical protein|uniref:hypothetical protein n=1 Tax=Rhizobium sp. RAF56 TaxID=3233062 RepID=UPI003F981ECD